MYVNDDNRSYYHEKVNYPKSRHHAYTLSPHAHRIADWAHEKGQRGPFLLRPIFHNKDGEKCLYDIKQVRVYKGNRTRKGY